MEGETKVVIYLLVATLTAILVLGWIVQREWVRALAASIGSVLSQVAAVVWSAIRSLLSWLKIAVACTLPFWISLKIMWIGLFDPENFLLWIAISVWFVFVYIRRDRIRA